MRAPGRSFGRPKLAIHKASDRPLAICLDPNEQPKTFGMRFVVWKWLTREVLGQAFAPRRRIDGIKESEK